MALAKYTWAKDLDGMPALYFIDHGAARYGLIRGDSHSPASANLISWAAVVDALVAALPWYARVLSAPKRLRRAEPEAHREAQWLADVPESQF